MSQKLCLVLIEKNEEAVIERALRSALPHIDCYVIVDTGSTDRTKEIIREVLRDLPGVILDRPWVNFGHNRTEAIDLAREHFPHHYALMLDADDTIETASEDWTLPELTLDLYMNPVVSDALRWQQPHVFRLSKPFFFAGVTHEYLTCREGHTSGELPEMIYKLGNDGNRRSSNTKFKSDIALLLKEIKRNPKDARSHYYLAQSYRDDGQWRKAMHAFLARAKMGSLGWVEETYKARLEAAKCAEWLNLTSDQVVSLYMEAHECRPQRAEALYHVGRYLRECERDSLAILFLDPARRIPKPNDTLFVEEDVYAWRAHAEFAISAGRLGRHAEALQANMFAIRGSPPSEHEWLHRNMSFSIPKPPTYEAFDKWYVEGGIGSGHGSSLEYTEKYRMFLESFLKKHDIRSVIDWGCGDWQFSRLIDWGGLGIEYRGIDVVKPLIEKLREKYGRDGTYFTHVNPLAPIVPIDHAADLVICKDVLQHMPNEDVQDLLQIFRNLGKKVLLINDLSGEPGKNNVEIHPGGYRHVDPRRGPFYLDCEPVFEFTEGGEGKTAFLWNPASALYIPKIIHQTWKDEDIPGTYDPRWRSSWQALHPGWECRFWTDEGLLHLVAKSIDPEIADVIASAPGVVKADIGRYLLLYKFGGVYVDLDYEALRNIEPLLIGHRAVTSWDSPPGTPRRCLNQAFLAAARSEPFFLHLAQEAARRWREGVRPVGKATGPDMVTEEWRKWQQEKTDPTVLHVVSGRRMSPVHWQGADGQCIASGKLTTEKIDELRPKLIEQGAYAVTYWTHNWAEPKDTAA